MLNSVAIVSERVILGSVPFRPGPCVAAVTCQLHGFCILLYLGHEFDTFFGSWAEPTRTDSQRP